MSFRIISGDLTEMETDAVVNAANSGLRPGGGVCGAIFAAAGYEDLERACSALGHCETGHAVLTEGFALKAKYVIHAVGPVWRGGGEGEAELLRKCYQNALLLAKEHRCHSVAFPLISSGIYGFPKDKALECAKEAIGDFLTVHEMDVYLVLFKGDAGALALKGEGFSEDSRDDNGSAGGRCCFMERNRRFLKNLQSRGMETVENDGNGEDKN